MKTNWLCSRAFLPHYPYIMYFLNNISVEQSSAKRFESLQKKIIISERVGDRSGADIQTETLLPIS